MVVMGGVGWRAPCGARRWWAQYKEGSKYPTVERFGFHASGDSQDPVGRGLARDLDALYVTQVSPDTVPLFAGLEELLPDLLKSGSRLGSWPDSRSSRRRPRPWRPPRSWRARE